MTAPEKTAPEKTPPTITEENRPFWEGAAEGRLMMQRCTDCEHIRNPIQALCPRCLSERLTWVELSGRGEVFARVVYHRAFNKAWADDVPYNMVLVQLDEGPRMYSNVVGVPSAEIAVGDRLVAVFEAGPGGVTIPRFRRAD
jgi:uncharacterized OB-fold protein